MTTADENGAGQTDAVEEGQPVTTPESEYDAAAEGVEVEASSDELSAEEFGAEEQGSEEQVSDELTGDEQVSDEQVGDEFDADAFDADLGIDTEAPAAVFSDRPVQTVGRRKEAVVRVRLMPGTGQFLLNGKTLEAYFPNKLHQQLIREPLVLLEKTERFDIFANLHGGGVSGQAGALRLAIARALIEVDAEDRPPLKRAGFLTRDPRVIERKKYGLKKARKAPQYSKR